MKYAIHTNAAVNSSKINSVLEDYQRNCSKAGCSEESIGNAHATYKIHFTMDPYYISKYSMFEGENLANPSLKKIWKLNHVNAIPFGVMNV